MSPMKQVRVRRGLVLASMVVMLTLPIATWYAGSRVHETADATEQIQAERAASIRRNCEDVNERHDEAVAKLKALVNAIPPGMQRRRAEQGLKGSLAIIEAIVPKRDCGSLVDRQVNTN